MMYTNLYFKSILLGISLIFMGCATSSNLIGWAPTDQEISKWDCNITEVKNAYQKAKAELEPGEAYIPQIGWDMCQVLAKIGYPSVYGYVGSVSQLPWGDHVTFGYSGMYGGTLFFVRTFGEDKWIIKAMEGFPR